MAAGDSFDCDSDTISSGAQDVKQKDKHTGIAVAGDRMAAAGGNPARRNRVDNETSLEELPNDVQREIKGGLEMTIEDRARWMWRRGDSRQHRSEKRQPPSLQHWCIRSILEWRIAKEDQGYQRVEWFPMVSLTK
jgi:hypothetical protein